MKREMLNPGDYETPLNYMHIDSRGTYILDKPQQGINPAIAVYSSTVPEAWELSMLSCWDYGARVGTHYDNTEETPKSKEGTISLKISNPFNEPRIHRNIPGGPVEAETYRQEVVDGIHDHWINPSEKKWTYTYHERLFDYNPSIDLNAEGRGLLLPKGVDQIALIIDDLERDITSKGAQATTWMPTADPLLESNRACLQRLWFRPLEDGNGGYLLNLNSHWRSRDDAKAWFLNVYAITDLQRKVAEDLSERINKPVRVGSYFDISDSLHIYGDYFKEFEKEFEKMRDDNLLNRVWVSDHPNFIFMVDEAREKLAKDPDYFKNGGI